MKTKLLLLAAATAVLAGCTDDLERRSFYLPEEGLQASIPAYPFDDGTRVSISNDLQAFTWNDGDQIGLYYLDGDITAHAGFGIVSGGSSTGTFTNSAFSLHPNSTYYGFYPFNESATVNEAPVDFTGQRQIVSGSAAHLGAMNYMYAVVNTDAVGDARINFQNLGSVMAIRLEAPATDKYSSLEIRSNDAQFITKGNASMTDGTVTPTETSNSISLYLGFIGDGISMTKGDLLTFYLLTAPVDLSGSTLSFVFHKPKEGSSFPLPFANMTGKNMQAGRAYLYDLTNRDAPYVTFTADATQTLRMNQEVPSLEYSLNNGAWQVLGTNTVTFGGTNGDLRLRGKSSVGTNGATISFGNSTPVGCSGDIRTLVDYENYETANTSEAKFKELFKDCTQLTTAPELPVTSLAESCYFYMFQGCSSLTQAPALPATTLTKNCYASMFANCDALTSAPELPATALAEACYNDMFNYCSSLTEAPELPATTLDTLCYSGMFQHCTSLTQAPELPATTLTDRCYFMMFDGCTSLTQAPELPATTLARMCYYNMFGDCTQLNYISMMATDISAFLCLSSWVRGVASTGTFVKNSAATWDVTGVNGIPEGWTVQTADGTPYVTFTANAEQTLQMSEAVSSLEYSVNGGAWTTLGTNTVAFGGMNGDIRLRGKSSVGTNGATITFGYTTPVTCSGDIRTLVDYENYDTANTSQAVFKELFKDCTQLTNAPRLPATTLADYCYESMFRGCTSLTQAPKLPATTLAYAAYHCMFQNCSSLTTAPELPATNLESAVYQSMFGGCTSLTTAPELPATTLAEYCYYGMFASCRSLTQAPELPATTLAEYCYAGMFQACSALIGAPALPATTLAEYCYFSMFANCPELTQAPALPATILASNCYRQMFYNCTSLVQAPTLPATTLTDACYVFMFAGCTALTRAPELPALALAPGCYASMFNGCTSLNYIKMLAADISAEQCLSNWVHNVSSSGSFVTNRRAGMEDYGDSLIPTGWVVTYIDYPS